ncbi:MAG TPA: DUF3037 domain-containing protein [Thermomicrobiaceae bacterium]|nr:DUF3037 domain-containing protein [Thermomicrobiaceae bacterium]
MPVPDNSFDYAIIRVVPDVERGECVNAGIILFCRTAGFLGVRIGLDTGRLLALAPAIDLPEVERELAHLVRVADGDPAAGPIARLSRSERFHWLVAPRSTVIQPSAVHTGLCDDPRAALERLVTSLVTLPAASGTDGRRERLPSRPDA